DEFRALCLQELRAARRAGLLKPGALDPQGLAEEVGAFSRFDDPQQVIRAEHRATEAAADELRDAGHLNLARLLTAGPGPSLLVVALRYFLRRAIEEDERLSRGLTFAQLEGLRQGQEQGFAALQQFLAGQGGRVEELLGDVQAAVAQTHEAVLD